MRWKWLLPVAGLIFLCGCSIGNRESENIPTPVEQAESTYGVQLDEHSPDEKEASSLDLPGEQPEPGANPFENREFQSAIYGKYELIRCDNEFILYRRHLETGEIDSFAADFVMWGDDWLVSVSCHDVEELPENVEDVWYLAKGDEEGARVSLWLDGEIVDIVPAPLDYEVGLKFSSKIGVYWIDEAKSHYSAETNTVFLYQPTIQTTIELFEGGETGSYAYYPDTASLAAVSPDGRYRAYHVSTGSYASPYYYHYAVYIENTVSGAKRYLYEDSYYKTLSEPVYLSNTLLCRSVENQYYSLETGQLLDLQLERQPHEDLPEHMTIVGGYAPSLGFAQFPDLGQYVSLSFHNKGRPTRGNPPFISIEIFGRNGNWIQRIDTEFCIGYRDLGAGALWPRSVYLSSYGNLLLMEDLGKGNGAFYGGFTEEEWTAPGLIVMDMETMMWRKLAGVRGAICDDGTIVTASREIIPGADNDYTREDNDFTGKYTFYHYQDSSLIGMLTSTLPDDDPWGDWDVRFDETEQTVIVESSGRTMAVPFPDFQ